MSYLDGKNDIDNSVMDLLEKARCFLLEGDKGSVVDCLALAISIIEDGDLGDN